MATSRLNFLAKPIDMVIKLFENDPIPKPSKSDLVCFASKPYIF